MRHPWVNTALLVLVIVQVASGLAGLFGSTEPYRIAGWAHAIGGYAIAAVLVNKAAIVTDAVRRSPDLTRPRRLLFLMLALLGATLVTGLVWITAGRVIVGGVSLVNWHAYLGIVLAALLVWHVLDRRFIFRVPGATDRAAFLRIAAVTAAGLAIWQVERAAQRLAGSPGSGRRFTGSYETGSYTGRFPEVIWLNDEVPETALGDYRLRIGGAVHRPYQLTYRELSAQPAETAVALIDCTGGWYSRQKWRGPRLGALLDAAGVAHDAASVEVVSQTGYARRFEIDMARELMLATAVAGRALSRGHGAPARLVVPDRRGFEWVKWVTEVRVLRSSHLRQSPLPLA